MTDKQIIIDGVDVSGCEYLRNCIIPDNYGCKIDDSLCCDVGNCYYKQLKRKEQECEDLKNFHINLVGVKECEIKELVKYKQALRDIKNIVDTCNSGINCSECPYTEDCRTDIEAEALGICKLILQKCEVLDE